MLVFLVPGDFPAFRETFELESGHESSLGGSAV